MYRIENSYSALTNALSKPHRLFDYRVTAAHADNGLGGEE